MSEEQSPPPAEGVRIPWSAVPEELRLAVERHLGDRVAEAVTQPGGFSPGVAARLRLAGGGRAFVKAVGPEPNPDSPAFHRAEARVAAALPAGVPAPRLLASFDQDGWVVLLFEDVEGRLPAQPWEPDELALVLGALARMAEALTPAPIRVPAAAERFGDEFRGWRRLAADGADLTGVLDPWAVRHLPRLAELEEHWGEAAEGACLAHADMRADNLLLTGDGRVLVVDWPHACLAAPWFDLVGMLPSVTMQGGPPPAQVFDGHPVARNADPGAVTAVLAAITGYFLQRGLLPPPPGLPTLRAFQLAQGRVALTWLRQRTGWR
ncbi:aminoglycoside phosphotransferase family protein [Microbispora cellulosiformans]|uniref:Aminoglycoside phosphotransferase family protein n=1 Tax=Microbispora cellulosiformans TaxID=2614688 RepID=A0A5J5KBI4_9ACTN|nr:aminoglycoside phosphotransferase family protein [Microbispora cellulosiformans]KAA9381975.1 aminoglycoside phosphotransferase family protein [Microbispora cellulosiformans]